MKAMILAIRLKYFYLTYKGIKTIEVRKTAPKDFVGDVYEYVSKTNFEKELLELPENEREFFKKFKGKVGLKFTVRKVEAIKYANWLGHLDKVFTDNLTEEELLNKSCLSQNEIGNYLGINCNCLFGIKDGYSGGYAYHIEDLVIFDKPKELNDFMPIKWDKCGVKDKNGLYQCNKCPYGEVLPYGGECHYKPLTKAPQNFMYIESEVEVDE